MGAVHVFGALVPNRDHVDREKSPPDTPQTARFDQNDGDRHSAEQNQIPSAEISQIFAEQKKESGSDNRALQAADAADNDSKDNIDGPIGDTERRGRRATNLLQRHQRARQTEKRRSPEKANDA